MKLSVIVPVYNVEKFLPRCLDSLLRQGLEVGEYEVICVNDGSPDNCAQILAEYEQKYPGIFRVITQENRGLGEARNTGMKVAQGEYVTFVDSDDYVVDGGLGFVYHKFVKSNLDVVGFRYSTVCSTDAFYLRDEKADIYEGKIIFEGDGSEAYNHIKPNVWSNMYRRTFLSENGIIFEPILCEDVIFNFQVFRRDPQVLLTDCSIYRYDIGNNESIMRTESREMNLRLLYDQLYGLKILEAFLFREESTRMEKGLLYVIRLYLTRIHKLLFKIRLTRSEWLQCRTQLKVLPINSVPYKKGDSFLGKGIVFLKNWSGRSYIVYLAVAFFIRNVFRKYLRKIIVKEG